LFREGVEFFAYLWEPVSNPQAGDIAMFKNVNGVATHVGVMIDKLKFIHACEKSGVVINPLAGKYKEKLYGFYRWKE
jgi:cell wall-associated NlpC family hydrolase